MPLLILILILMEVDSTFVQRVKDAMDVSQCGKEGLEVVVDLMTIREESPMLFIRWLPWGPLAES